MYNVHVVVSLTTFFYTHNTCTSPPLPQGDQCKFRHCSAALGSEEVCGLWLNGRCSRALCAFRHCTLDVSQASAE